MKHTQVIILNKDVSQLPEALSSQLNSTQLNDQRRTRPRR